jgi:hypothetical protein
MTVTRPMATTGMMMANIPDPQRHPGPSITLLAMTPPAQMLMIEGKMLTVLGEKSSFACVLFLTHKASWRKRRLRRDEVSMESA